MSLPAARGTGKQASKSSTGFLRSQRSRLIFGAGLHFPEGTVELKKKFEAEIHANTLGNRERQQFNDLIGIQTHSTKASNLWQQDWF
jgi:hypothetical protein